LNQECDIKPQFPSCAHTKKFIYFNGTVTKAYSPIILEFCQKYVCMKCGLDFTQEVDYANQDLLLKPYKCPKDDCDSTKFKCLEVNSKSIRVFEFIKNY
jgi:DNA replicative helicase MCM subunit Mcm2 (Cdc46/Mcm family)